MKTNIKQEHHYALSKAGVLTHIKDAKAIGGDYFCPHCKCRMIKKCGQIRQWHFAHDKNAANEIQRQCTYETYLHSYAKMRLEQWFNNSVSIIIRYNTRYLCNKFNACKLKIKNTNDCSIIKDDTINIKKHLNKCVLEKDITIGNKSFRPDLIWYNDKKNIADGIFIEVKVTHGCKEAKMNSSARIIEFEIESEDDVDKIISNEIAENEYTHFYGFKIKTSKKILDIPINQALYKFILLKDGKGLIRKFSCRNYLTREKESCIEFTVTSDITNSDLYKCGYYLAQTNNIQYKNCKFCRHSFTHYINYRKIHMCKIHYITPQSLLYKYNFGRTCDDFESNDEDYSRYYNNYKSKIIDNWVSDDLKENMDSNKSDTNI